jgi:hypothetical protein
VLIERHVSQTRLFLQGARCDLVSARSRLGRARVPLDLICVLHEVVDASLAVALRLIEYLGRRLRLVVI